MDSEEQGGFKWETAYTEGLNIRNVLEENEGGSIEDSIRRLILETKRGKRVLERQSKIRLGIMRYLYVIVDFSSSMLSQELYPTKLKVSLNRLNAFLDKFFELNPLSQIGVIICREKRAERIQSFTSSAHEIKESLSNFSEAHCGGEFSLYSSLQLALQSFHGLPGHSSKEIILITSSLATIDSGSLPQCFEILKMRSIRCSVISLAAEVYVFKKLCSTTSGKHCVILDDQHFELLFNDHVQPPPAQRGQEASIVKMGFPQRCEVKLPSFCMCHESAAEGGISAENKLSKTLAAEGSSIGKLRAFFCPQCGARYCQTPVECRVCGLLLLTAPQLARAHQHFEPLNPFIEATAKEKNIGECFGCGEPLDQKIYTCEKCLTEFCIDCDLLLHESLQICPSCG